MRRHTAEKFVSGLTLVHPTAGRQPFALYPYQRALLRSAAPERLVVKARQVGVSQLIAAEALYLASTQAGATALFVSRNLAAAQHLQRLVYQLAANAELPVAVVRKSGGALELANESAIRSLPASESTGRTYAAAAAYLDEFAHARGAAAIYQGVAPTASRGGRLAVVSTPRGKANLFYRLYQEAVMGLNAFEIHRIHWSDCPEYNPDGFAEPDPDRRRQIGLAGAWYAANRPRYGDDDWAQEYECDFTASVGLVYREFDPQVHVIDYEWRPDWPTFAGQDFGYQNPAVCLLAQQSPSEDFFVFHEQYRASTPISTLAEELYAPLARRYRVGSWYCDPSGATEISELQKAGILAVPGRSKLRPGLQLVRRFLKPPGGQPPKLYLSRACRRLAADLATYAYRPDSEEPEKDVADHGPDALRYLLMGRCAGRAEAEVVGWR